MLPYLTSEIFLLRKYLLMIDIKLKQIIIINAMQPTTKVRRLILNPHNTSVYSLTTSAILAISAVRWTVTNNLIGKSGLFF